MCELHCWREHELIYTHSTLAALDLIEGKAEAMHKSFCKYRGLAAFAEFGLEDVMILEIWAGNI